MNLLNKKFDIMSDLHIDSWSNKYNRKYKKGKISEVPLKLINTESEYLIIAGDISDNIERTFEYLNNLSNYYELILFIDGNHEHTENFPNLLDYEDIYNILKKNKKIIYLRKESFIMEDTVFVGCNGWWNYNNKDEITIKEYLKDGHLSYYNFNPEDKLNLIKNIINKADEEFTYLNNEINKYDKNYKINNIVVITHTIPNVNFGHSFMRESINNNFSTQYNSRFKELSLSKKIKYWIFGHVHGQHNINDNNINFICHPRGCPGDYNREDYKEKQIDL